MRLFGNPFFCFVMSFSCAFLLYSPSLSELFPLLSAEVIYFLIFVVSIMTLFGLASQLKVNRVLLELSNSGRQGGAKWLLYGILPFALIEIVLYPNLPIILVLRGAAEHKSFVSGYGVPGLHALVLIVLQIVIVQGLGEKFIYKLGSENKSIPCVLVATLLLLAFFSRGAIVVSYMAFFLVYLSCATNWFSVFKVACAVVVGCYFFGLAGDLRSGGANYFLEIGKANTEVFGSWLPSSFFWIYMYLVSPLANLDMAINYSVLSNDLRVFLLDIVPDVFSKRLTGAGAEWEHVRPLIAPPFTVGSIFARPYYYSGVTGAIFVFAWMMCVFLMLLFFAGKAKMYKIPILGFTCVMGFLSVFTNTIVFSSLIGPVLLCVLIDLLARFKVR
jgi:hypothetical protein